MIDISVQKNRRQQSDPPSLKKRIYRPSGLLLNKSEDPCSVESGRIGTGRRDMAASHSEEALYYEGAPLSLSLLMRRTYLSTTSNVIDGCNMPAPIHTHSVPHFITNFNGSHGNPALGYLLTPTFCYSGIHLHQPRMSTEEPGSVSWNSLLFVDRCNKCLKKQGVWIQESYCLMICLSFYECNWK